MLELDPKELRKIESVCFKEAKRNTPTKNMNLYADELLKYAMVVFVSHFLPRLHRNREIAANAKKMDFETVCATLLERHGKYADVEKDSRGFDYLYIKFHEGGVICLEPFRSGYYSTGFTGCESLITGDDIPRFCDVVEFIATRIPIWKPIAERIKFAVQKDLMKNKISVAAVEALLKAKLTPLGLKYNTLVKRPSSNIKVILSDKKEVNFYIKNAKLLANPDAFINVVKTLNDFVTQGNDFRIKRYYKSNNNHFWI
ncbi:MAG: hypothetical protein II939_10600 [Bacteroidales bacterium]|nr:hypothetical protein [Bacteroidales bacterium]